MATATKTKLGEAVCEVCGLKGSALDHPCSFRRACSCWRGVPCVRILRPIYSEVDNGVTIETRVRWVEEKARS